MQGGKLDDITVVTAVLKEAETPRAAAAALEGVDGGQGVASNANTPAP